MYFLHGHFSPFHFLVFFLKILKEDALLVFLGTRFHIWGSLYVTISVPIFVDLLFMYNRHWKFRWLYLLFLIMNASCITAGEKPFKDFYVSLKRVSKLFWCIVFSSAIWRMSWKELTWSLWINLRARSWNKIHSICSWNRACSSIK